MWQSDLLHEAKAIGIGNEPFCFSDFSDALPGDFLWPVLLGVPLGGDLINVIFPFAETANESHERGSIMTERSPQSSYQLKPARQVMVPAEDADMIRKVHRILKAGKNVEINQDTNGHTKVFKVSKEIEQ